MRVEQWYCRCKIYKCVKYLINSQQILSLEYQLYIFIIVLSKHVTQQIPQRENDFSHYEGAVVVLITLEYFLYMNGALPNSNIPEIVAMYIQIGLQ